MIKFCSEDFWWESLKGLPTGRVSARRKGFDLGVPKGYEMGWVSDVLKGNKWEEAWGPATGRRLAM